MAAGYLDALDALLRMGMSQLSPEFTRRQADFVAARQLPDGGFGGRQGGSDLYYTDFGLRLTRLLSLDHAVPCVAEWTAQRSSDAANCLDCFSILNIRRLLNDLDVEMPVDQAPLLSVIEAQRLVRGGFCRPESDAISAYNTFLTALCLEILGREFANADSAVTGILRLRRLDGGYSETPDQLSSQTNATAAAVAFLTMQDAPLRAGDAELAARFLSKMQTEDGGLLAQPSAPEADLLSTFTGVLTLFGLNAIDRLNLPAVAQFVGALVAPGGGFRASLSDDEPDIEYTYYGLGTMALLRAYVIAREN